jgi:hypothetical protein
LANGYCISALFLILYGCGYHVWDIPERWHIPYAKVRLVDIILRHDNIAKIYDIQLERGSTAVWQIAIPLTKTSIAVTYLRLFPSTLDRYFCFGMIVYTIGYMFSVPFTMIWTCNPIAKFWDPSISGYCVDQSALYLATGVINTLSDFLVYLWPVRVFWHIQIARKQRIGLIVMFSFGVMYATRSLRYSSC